jgi:hypothetical protein
MNEGERKGESCRRAVYKFGAEEIDFFRPSGACAIAPFTTHGLHRGLHSFAPSELGVDIQDGNVTRVTPFRT